MGVGQLKPNIQAGVGIGVPGVVIFICDTKSKARIGGVAIKATIQQVPQAMIVSNVKIND